MRIVRPLLVCIIPMTLNALCKHLGLVYVEVGGPKVGEVTRLGGVKK